MSDGQLYAVIMAGGSGTRFWPASRRARPKQLLPLGDGETSLLRATVDRIAPRVPTERVIVVTAAPLVDAVAEALPGLPAENILAEPAPRNTAPCIGWAAATIARRDPNATLAVFPADHHVREPEALLAAMDTAADAAAAGDLVTIGIRPTRPETGYGYLELGDELRAGVHRARRFVEKPNAHRAAQFLARGNFLWNAGMFFFRADTMRDAIRAHLPGLAEGLEAFDAAAENGDEAAAVEAGFAALPSVSIDHGVMEKAERVAVVPVSCGWSDLGSWTTAWELAERDDDENAIPSDAIAVRAGGNYVSAPDGKLVALVGVSDLVIVDTADALLIVPREQAQDVRDVVKALGERDDPRR